MTKVLVLIYGVISYLVFLGSFLYAIGFVTGLYVPKTIDTGPAGPLVQAVVINLIVLSVFALQHSIMARQGFKRWWTQFVSPAIERSTYVLLASLALVLVMWQWQPIPQVVWEISNPTITMALLGLSLFGFVLVVTSTFLINHFELFGLYQVALNLVGKKTVDARFKTPVLYKLVRHPIYLGFIIAFWAAPVMTVGHLLFAAVTTAYIFVGIWLEERDLVAMFGDEYRRYRERVGMVFPKFARKPAGSLPTEKSAAV